jgi:23S rRNA pseudouridine2605 synthase
VFETLPEELPRVVAIGRLDINTEGLLLLTNDGGLAKVIAHPDTGWLRRYKVRAHGEVEQADLDRLRGGVSIEGMDYGPIEASLDRRQGDNVWITLGLREGKNREVKRILEHLGLQVNRLIRLSFGPFQLGDLEPGLVEEVRTKVLKEQLGATLAQTAGVDFESPVREPIAPFGPKKAAPEREPPRARFERSGERFGRKDERFGRSRDGARPRGWDEGGPQRGGRPPRDRDDAPRPAPRPGQPRPTVWRDEDGDAGHRKGHKAPRRGADPKAARAALAERPRERVGAVEGREGRKVVVERLVAAPEADRGPVRRPAKRAAPVGDDRPRRREGFQAPDRARNRDPGRSDAPFRKPRSGPGRERTPGGEDRPARKPGGFRNGRDGGDRPRGAERTGFGKGPRGFGGGPRRGPEGGPGRGSGKGPPRGRRP